MVRSRTLVHYRRFTLNIYCKIQNPRESPSYNRLLVSPHNNIILRLETTSTMSMSKEQRNSYIQDLDCAFDTVAGFVTLIHTTVDCDDRLKALNRALLHLKTMKRNFRALYEAIVDHDIETEPLRPVNLNKEVFKDHQETPTPTWGSGVVIPLWNPVPNTLWYTPEPQHPTGGVSFLSVDKADEDDKKPAAVVKPKGFLARTSEFVEKVRMLVEKEAEGPTAYNEALRDEMARYFTEKYSIPARKRMLKDITGEDEDEDYIKYYDEDGEDDDEEDIDGFVYLSNFNKKERPVSPLMWKKPRYEFEENCPIPFIKHNGTLFEWGTPLPNQLDALNRVQAYMSDDWVHVDGIEVKFNDKDGNHDNGEDGMEENPDENNKDGLHIWQSSEDEDGEEYVRVSFGM